MELTKAFKEAIQEGKVQKIRIMLKNSMLADPSLVRFEEMERAAASVKGLYDEHDGRKFIENPNEWNDEYMNKIMVQVVDNFSHKRVEHLKEVVRKLRPVAETETNTQFASKTIPKVTQNPKRKNSDRKTNTYQEQKKQDQKDGLYKYAVGIGTGAVIGGIVGGVGGTIVSLPFGGVMGTIGGAALGAAAGGAVVYLTSEKE